MPGSYLMGRWLNYSAGASPAEVGIVRAGRFYERIGNTFGDRHQSASINVYRAPVKAIHYMDSVSGGTLFAVAELSSGSTLRIFEYDGASTWTAVFDPNVGVDADQSGGFLHTTGTDGKPYLVFVCASQDTVNGIGFSRWDGSTWVKDHFAFGTALGMVAFAHLGLVHVKMLRTSSTWEWLIYDAQARTISLQSFGPAVAVSLINASVFFTLEDRLFMLGSYGLSGARVNATTFEYVFGVWTETASAVLVTIGGNNFSNATAAIRISDTKVLLIGPGSSGDTATGGMVAHLGVISGGVVVWTNVTTPVIPLVLRPPSLVGDPNDYGCYGIVDNDTVPGTPEFFVYFCPDMDAAGTAWTLFKVTDELTELTIVGDVQADNSWGPPALYYGGGECSLVPGELNIIIDDVVQTGSGVRLDYRCSGDPGSSDKKVSFKFFDGQSIPVNVCSLLAGTATGGSSVVVGNEVQLVDALPTTLYTVVWAFGVDGVVDASQVSIVAIIDRS